MVCAVSLLSFRQSVAVAANDDHVVCSFSQRSTNPPEYLDEVFSVYFEKTGGTAYHNATLPSGKSTITFRITERDGGLHQMYIQTDKAVLLNFDSIKPVPFVGEYSLPTLYISTEKYYFMCRESDAGWITANFANAVLIK